MKDQYKAFNISVGMHMLIIMAVFSVGSWGVHQRQVVKIDLSTEDSVKKIAAPAPEVKRRPMPAKVSRTVKPSTQKTVPAVHNVQMEKQAPLPVPVIQKQEPEKEIMGPSSQAFSHAAGTLPKSREMERMVYLKERFIYIRDLVQKIAIYPKMAQSMAWEGRVVVSFLILSDGKVRNIRVVTSSGKEILDNSAMEAVRCASPFPKPPVEVELKIPIIYKLL